MKSVLQRGQYWETSYMPLAHSRVMMWSGIQPMSALSKFQFSSTLPKRDKQCTVDLYTSRFDPIRMKAMICY
jgi:hypothetical protein